ncbi:MAG: hypothetical protein GX571_01090, partial [Lentisphaerae bacterium]|nr:hypothetical protein [Lentisphaerota bacterium]
GGETFAFVDTNRLVNGLELRWRAFGLLDPGKDDHDGDGLSTYDEVMIYDSDPRLPDTDLDGLPDAIEVQLGTLLRERDTDGDGIPDGSDPDPLVPNAADADGDGLPDAWELFRFGSTNAADSAAADSDTDGFGNLAEMLIGSDPAFAVCAVSASEGAHTFTWTDLTGATGYTLSVASNGMQVWSCATNACSLTLTNAFPTGDCTLTVVSSGGVTSRTAQIAFATPAAPNLTAWRIADPFALVPPAADGVILERTFDIARSGGWQQFFVSSSPDGAGAWSLEHLRLDWSDSAGASGSATASPSGDSLRLSLSTNSPQVLTIRLVATGTNVLARSPGTLHLLGWSPAIDLAADEGAALAATTNGPVLAAVTDLGGGTTAASFTVDRGGRPCNTPPAPGELAQQANPFAADSGAEFTGSHGASGELIGGALLAGAPGIFPLPGAGGGNAPTSGGGAAQAGSPAAPSGAVALIAPIVTQLHDHRGCPYDGSDGYPFDSACLREAWLNAGGGAGESTGLTVSLGSEALNAFFTVTVNGTEGREYMWQGDETSADVEIAMGGSTVWEQVVDREPSSSFGCTHLWEAECGGCGGCAGGDCDGVEGDSLGSLRFRVPLGFTGHKRLAGFLWFSMETPQAITPALFQADVAPGVSLQYDAGGMLDRALCDAPGGRDIAVTNITNGVRLSIRDAGATGEEFSWTITGTGGDVTFMRQDNASPANTLRHTTYSYSSGVWTRADHLAGAEESLEATDYPPDDEQDPWEKSEWLTFTAA